MNFIKGQRPTANNLSNFKGWGRQGAERGGGFPFRKTQRPAQMNM